MDTHNDMEHMGANSIFSIPLMRIPTTGDITMSTTLTDNTAYTLTRFWGGDRRGVMYQITQENRYVSLSEKQIKHILKIIDKERIKDD